METDEDQVDPFQLAFVVKLGAMGPDHTEWQADEHRPGMPVADDRDGAENTEAERNPFQSVFEPC